jgi:hypothetical protein
VLTYYLESNVNARADRGKPTMDAPVPHARTCVIFAKPAGEQSYGWGWESGDKRRRSKGYFRYFYECVQDARQHGYEIEFAQVAEQLRTTTTGARV